MKQDMLDIACAELFVGWLRDLPTDEDSPTLSEIVTKLEAQGKYLVIEFDKRANALAVNIICAYATGWRAAWEKRNTWLGEQKHRKENP